MDNDDAASDYVCYSPETIKRLIDELPEQVTSTQLAAVVNVDLRRLTHERARGRVPATAGKRGTAFVYDREAVRQWITDRLEAIEHRLQLDQANIGRLMREYGDCHVSDYYIHGYAPYMYPVVSRPEPEHWPVVA